MGLVVGSAPEIERDTRIEKINLAELRTYTRAISYAEAKTIAMFKRPGSGLVRADQVVTGLLKSKNYKAGESGSLFNLDTGYFETTNGKFRGELEAATGSFKGSLEAATGSFKGSLEAATGVFRGIVEASGGLFKGYIDSYALKTQAGPNPTIYQQSFSVSDIQGKNIYEWLHGIGLDDNLIYPVSGGTCVNSDPLDVCNTVTSNVGYVKIYNSGYTYKIWLYDSLGVLLKYVNKYCDLFDYTIYTGFGSNWFTATNGAVIDLTITIGGDIIRLDIPNFDITSDSDYPAGTLYSEGGVIKIK